MVVCGQVNGHSLVGVTHHEAVAVLKDAGDDVTVVVGRLMKKPKPSPQQPAQTTSTFSRSSGLQPKSPTTDDVLPPQLVKSHLQRPVTSPVQPIVPPANQSLSPERSSRLSGTTSPQYEVGILLVGITIES